MGTLTFKKLRAEDVEVRIGQTNEYGVRLLLYKNSRTDARILDETVGPMNWQKRYSRDNANCTVSIWDDEKKMWIEKEDTGKASNTEKEKGLASDSFKRACTCWGIGRELYSVPETFIFKNQLRGYKLVNGQPKCTDSFIVSELVYDEKEENIKSVTITVLEKGKPYYSQKFQNGSVTAIKAQGGVNQEVPSAPSQQVQTVPTTPSQQNNRTSQPPSGQNNSVNPAGQKPFPLSDDEILLFGSCRGKKVGDVKNSDLFHSFLRWVATANTSYNESDVNEQFKKLKEYATAS